MKPKSDPFTNENGAVLVLSMLIMVAAAIIGVASISTSTIEQDISGNEKFHKIAFYHADSGIYATPKVISYCVDKSELPPPEMAPCLIFLDPSGLIPETDPEPGQLTPQATCFYELMGFQRTLGREAHDAARDIRFDLENDHVDVDISRSGQVHLAGGGTEFASGAEGIGAGSVGGVGILFDIDALGSTTGTSQSNVLALYRKVLGVHGGL